MANYLIKRYGRRGQPPAMGDLASILGAAEGIADDPYLPEMVCMINQLKQINNNLPVAVCTPTADGLPGGVGIGSIIAPMRAFVYAQQNKWVYGVAALALIGLPMWLGYELGKESK